jgi:ribosomal protein L24E
MTHGVLGKGIENGSGLIVVRKKNKNKNVLNEKIKKYIYFVVIYY